MALSVTEVPSNIEIKARMREPERQRSLAEGLSDTPAEIIEQHDTFFPCPQGRLKLRRFTSSSGELIYYRRPNTPGTRQCDYLIVPTPAPVELLEVLSAALGAGQTVTKTRLLLRSGQTRIHLDEVASLGTFIELEVVLRENQEPEEGHAIARKLMDALDIRKTDLLDKSYADLLRDRAHSST